MESGVAPKLNGAGFDLADMETTTLSEKGVAFPVMRVDRPGEQLKNRDGSPVFVTVLGPDSTAYRRTQQEVLRKRLEDGASTGAVVTPEEMALRSMNDAITILAAVTLSWTFRTASGDLIPCTPENAAGLYREYPAIRDQIDNRVSRRANFLQASPSA